MLVSWFGRLIFLPFLFCAVPSGSHLCVWFLLVLEAYTVANVTTKMASGVIRDSSSREEQHGFTEEKLGEKTVLTVDGETVNASGHRDQLKRHYGMLSICGLALSVDNAWVAFGTSLTLSICKSCSSIGLSIAQRADLYFFRQWWSTRCLIRVPRRRRVLRFHRSITRRTRFSYSQCWWCVSLGIDYSQQKGRSCRGVLCWISELLRMAVRSSINCLHHV